VQLMQSPTLEYLFYVAQIGITMSPLSNTVNSIPYLENPFPTFFRRGLKVSLATNEPLHFHYTQEPLIEEYSIAHKIWKLSYNDLCEVARNSVLISGFSDAFKSTALGPLHFLHSPLGNDVKKSRVSDIRVAYRYETYHTELNFLDDLLGDSMPRALQMLEKEVDIYEEKTGTKVEMPADGLDGDEVETVESLQAQIQEATMQIKRGKIQMQSLAEANIQLTKEIQRILKSSREPMKLSANLSDLSQFLQSQ
jgi:AMP deaminase